MTIKPTPTPINEQALDKAAREGYAVRCKTNGPRVLAQYASPDIMRMQLDDARVIVSAYLDALSVPAAAVAGGPEIEHAEWLEACATNEPSQNDAEKLWTCAQLIRTLASRISQQDAELERVRRELEEARRLIRWAHDTLWEINPSNYDHDEVCKLNDASVEVILGLAVELGEKHGKSDEWWEKHRAARQDQGDNQQ